jgi:hypothetical protein
LRFTGFTYALPYYDQIDEPWLFYEAAFQRGLLGAWLHPNPSQGLIALYKVMQIGAEAITGHSALASVTDIITVMRAISVVASLITLVFIGLCARELAGNKAGWLAAAVWTVIPFVIYHSFIAIAEPWMMLFGALALWCAAATFRRSASGWPLLSVWAGLAAFAFKYSMFGFAGLGVAASLWRWWSEPGKQRRWLRLLGFQALSIIAFLGWLALFGGLAGDVSSPGREVAVFLNNPLAKLADLNTFAVTLGVTFTQIGLPPILFALLYTTALLILARHAPVRQNARLAIWMLLALFALFSALLIPFYLMTDATLTRYVFAADLVLVIIGASSGAVIYDAAIGAIPRQRRAVIALTLILCALWLRPLAVVAVAEARDRLKPHTLTDLTVWASNTLGEGDIITEGAGNRAFSRELGGYTGLKRAWTYGELLSKTPAEWNAAGYRYIEMAGVNEDTLRQTPAGNAYLDGLLMLRRFPPPESTQPWTGLPFVVYWLGRPQQALAVTFGASIRLVGVDGVRERAAPGEILTLRLFWNALRTPDGDKTLFIHLTPANDRTTLIAQADGPPAGARRPTQTWTLPSETLVGTPFTLKLPTSMVPGNYRVWVGLYDLSSGQRLATDTGDDTLLMTLSVAP